MEQSDEEFLADRKDDWAATITQSLINESDRGCILIGTALLDEALIEGLKRAFRQKDAVQKNVVAPMFESNGPLSSFSHRINVAYALGVISVEAHHDLHLIRRLRNEVAHLYGPTSFQDPKVRARIRSLKITPTLTHDPLIQFKDGVCEHKLGQNHDRHKELMTDRLAFMLALSHMYGKLLAAGHIYTKLLFKARAQAEASIDLAMKAKKEP